MLDNGEIPMDNVAIHVNGVVKEYEVYAQPFDLALEVLTRRCRHTVFRALDGVSFDVERGEVLGIIGPNGAGKSTLLKIITGVLDCSSGSIEVRGRVTAILELGLGFNPEYTGRQNIYLSGLLYGMDRAEVDQKIDSIIEFSGVGAFIDRQVKTYSSGMHSRLAFSIATAVDPDILIIDEALAAGDAGFVQKCLRRIRQLCSGGRTVLLVSHGTGLLAQLCSRVVWMENGRVRMVGPAITVIQAYDLAAHQSADSSSWIEMVNDELGQNSQTSLSRAVPSPHARSESDDQLKTLFLGTAQHGHASPSDTGKQIFRRGPVFIESTELYNAKGELTNRLTLCESARLRVAYRVEGALPISTLGIAISINNRADLSPVAQYYTQNIRPNESRDSYDAAIERVRPAQSGFLDLTIDEVPFRKGDYLLSIGLLPNEPGTWEFYEYRHFYYPFSVDDAGMDVGAPIFLKVGMVHTAALADDVLTEGTVGHDVPLVPQPYRAGDRDVAAPLTLRAEIERTCRQTGGYPEAWPRHSHCPACGVGRLRRAFEKYGFTHDGCDECHFVCVNPYPPDGVMAALYDGAYYTKVRELFELPRLLSTGESTPFSAPRDALENIVTRATRARRSGSWLDVGGGIGAFANLVATMRPDWSVSLNESNTRSIEIANGSFKGVFRTVAGTALELMQQGERYDVISSVAVVEHIPTPLEFLEGYARLLKPGGVLITVVPHFTALNLSVSRGSSPNVVPPFHVSLFNETSLRRMLERMTTIAGIDIEQAGPAAFRLIDHVDTGDSWDISIPTTAEPVPRSLQIQPYTHAISIALNALASAQELTNTHFATTDGQLLLVAYCTFRSQT